jgi:hypothetical protein
MRTQRPRNVLAPHRDWQLLREAHRAHWRGNHGRTRRGGPRGAGRARRAGDSLFGHGRQQNREQPGIFG